MRDEIRGTVDAEEARYADQPFAAGPDLVLQQVGWHNRLTGMFYALNERVPVAEAARVLNNLVAVYEVNGRHYREPGHDE